MKLFTQWFKFGFYRKKYKQQNNGYNFEIWLEETNECTLRPIHVVEIFSGEQVQYEVKQCNFVPIDSVCTHYKEFEHVTFLCPKEKLFTLIEEE